MRVSGPLSGSGILTCSCRVSKDQEVLKNQGLRTWAPVHSSGLLPPYGDMTTKDTEMEMEERGQDLVTGKKWGKAPKIH